MKTLSENTFRTLAGDGAYQRGLEYYNQGKVSSLAINKHTISAQVTGTELYNVDLHHTAKLFEGTCDCPASDNFDFCKHCVAAALAYYYQTQTNQELAESGDADRVRLFLNTLTKPQLANELYKLIKQNSETLDYWQLKSDIASGGLEAPEIRKRITKAIPYKPSGVWRYREVAQYFAQCERDLSILTEPLFALEPISSFKLVVYALQRLEKTLQTVDDSGGYRDDSENLLKSWFETLLRSEQWNDEQKADRITQLVLDDAFQYDLLNLPNDAQQFLDDSTFATIYTSINKHWQTLSPENEMYSEAYYHYNYLEGLLLKRAQKQNDSAQEFKILERGAINIERCLTLVDLCIANNLLDDAQKWLSYATQITQPNSRELYEIETAQIDLYLAQKNYQQALHIQWARFEEQEHYELFNAALNTAAKLKLEQQWLEKGINSVKHKLVPKDSTQKNRQRAELLVEIYLQHDLIEQAVIMSGQFILRAQTLITIADKSTIVNDKTFDLIEMAANRLLTHANKNIYRQTISMLKQQSKRLGSAHPHQFKAMIMRIYNKPENKRKINFIEPLKAAFPDYF